MKQYILYTIKTDLPEFLLTKALLNYEGIGYDVNVGSDVLHLTQGKRGFVIHNKITFCKLNGFYELVEDINQHGLRRI
jgi:hypothetical protein